MEQFRNRLESDFDEQDLSQKSGFISVGIVLDQVIIGQMNANFGQKLEQHLKSSVGMLIITDEGSKVNFKLLGPGVGGACRKTDLIPGKFILLR